MIITSYINGLVNNAHYHSKKMRSLIVVATLFLAQSSAQYFGNYYCKDGKDVFVHLFEWKWNDIANECENFLAHNGFCAVQVSEFMIIEAHKLQMFVAQEHPAAFSRWQRSPSVELAQRPSP